MDALHQVVHGSLTLSAPFVAAIVALTIVATSLALATSRTRRLSARSRHLVLSLALILPVLAALLAASGAGAAVRGYLRAPEPASAAPAEIVLTGLAAVEPTRARSELPCVLFAIWAAVAAALVARMVRHSLRWSRVAHRGAAVTDPVILGAFDAASTDVDPPPRLAVSDVASEPMAVGLFRPTILLPASYVTERGPTLTLSEIEAVLAHELAHVRRRDNLTAVLHELASSIFWFDPLHWIARRRVLELRERACDERVLDLGCGADAYVSALAKSCHAAIESPAIACMSGFHIRERIDSIMSYPSDRSRFAPDNIVRAVAMTAVLLVIAAFGAFAPVPSLVASELATAPETTGGAYRLKVMIFPAGEGKVRLVVAISTPSSGILSAEATVLEGRPATVETRDGDRTLKVDIPAVAVGQPASLEVREEKNAVIERATSTIGTRGAASPSNAEPISVILKDADLNDFLKTLSQMSGVEIRLDPGITGKISINAVDMPWDVALASAITPLGLQVVPEGDALRVVRRATRSVPPPPPPGYERVGGDVLPPMLISRVEPMYTLEARAERVAGIVILNTLIDENGDIKDITILKDLPFGLGQAAADAVRQWKFKPATRDGKPVPVIFNVTVNFKLDTTNAPPQ